MAKTVDYICANRIVDFGYWRRRDAPIDLWDADNITGDRSCQTIATGFHKPSEGSYYRRGGLIVGMCAGWYFKAVVEAAQARRRLANVISVIYMRPYGYRKIIVRRSLSARIPRLFIALCAAFSPRTVHPVRTMFDARPWVRLGRDHKGDLPAISEGPIVRSPIVTGITHKRAHSRQWDTIGKPYVYNMHSLEKTCQEFFWTVRFFKYDVFDILTHSFHCSMWHLYIDMWRINFFLI